MKQLIFMTLLFLVSHLHAQSRGLTFFIDGLYWYTSEVTDWCFILEGNGDSLGVSYKTFDFGWAPGLRAGLKCQMNHACYDMQAYYTRMRAQASGKAQGAVTPAFLAARLSLLEPFSSGQASLDIDYNMFDWDLGVNLGTGSGWMIRPAIGLKGGWINQRIDSRWARMINNDLIRASEKLAQNFGGAGPKGAIDIKWCFEGWRLYFTALFDASYLWGHWTICDKYIDSFLTLISVKTDDRNFGALTLHSFLGFEWEPSLWGDRLHLKVKLGYEIENWLNQLQIFSDDSGSQNNNLMLQGFTLGAAVRF